MSAHQPLAELSGIGKKFAGVSVLSEIDLSIFPGTVHAIVGENGAGKSTLGKIIGGIHRPDHGSVSLAGSKVTFRSPADALARGITVMQQEIALSPHLSVVQNVLLGREPCRLGFVQRRQERKTFSKLLAATGFDLPPDATVGSLPLAVQQQVEILRALARQARLIVMDEPTAALPSTAARALQQIIDRLRESGVAIVYVSHFLEEALDLSDTVTVMRNGRVVETKSSSNWTIPRMVEAMLGRSLIGNYPALPPTPSSAKVRLEVRGLAAGDLVKDMHLTVRAGEVVGLFGLVGSGRSELAHAIFGASHFDSGTLILEGQEFRPQDPSDALAKGVSLLPESRKEQGLFLDHSKRRNAVASGLAVTAALSFVKRRDEKAGAVSILKECAADVKSLEAPVGTLSGGNQQKVLLGKTLYLGPRTIILDEPTRGVDIGARHSIYETISNLAGRGISIIIISSDIEEVHRMSHRLYVVRDGRTVAEFESAAATHSEILAAAFGVS